MAENPEPIIKEILASDLLTLSYMPYGYGWINVNTLDPGVVWNQLKADPLFGCAVYEDMEEKDDVIASSMDTRKGGVLAKGRRVLPASDRLRDKKIAEFVQETLDGYFDVQRGEYTGLDAVLWEMLDAVGRGVSIGEILWADGGDRIYIQDIHFKPQHLFAFGETALAPYSTASYLYPQTGPLRVRSGFAFEGIGQDGLLPENKFIVATWRPRYSNRWGSPLLRKCFWPSWFKRNGLKQWLKYLEKGTGTMVARYNDGGGQSEQDLALAGARAIVEESAVALPKKFLTELIDHVRQNQGESHSQLVDNFSNNAIMRVILGQTLTSRGSEGGGSRALGEVHETVRSEKVESDAKFLMGAVNRYLVWPLVMFNFGPVKPPKWIIDYDPQKDLTASAEMLERLIKTGLRVTEGYVYELFQIPEPADGDKIIKPLAPAASPDSGTKEMDGNETDQEGEDNKAEFEEPPEAEKKTSLRPTPSRRPSSRMERFGKLRPSTMPPWKE